MIQATYTFIENTFTAIYNNPIISAPIRGVTSITAVVQSIFYQIVTAFRNTADQSTAKKVEPQKSLSGTQEIESVAVHPPIETTKQPITPASENKKTLTWRKNEVRKAEEKAHRRACIEIQKQQRRNQPTFVAPILLGAKKKKF